MECTWCVFCLSGSLSLSGAFRSLLPCRQHPARHQQGRQRQRGVPALTPGRHHGPG